MIHLKNTREALETCMALGSVIRMDILDQILTHGIINLDTLAKNLHLTNAALTKHIKMLEETGLIKVEIVSAKHGLQKQCSIANDRIVIDITK